MLRSLGVDADAGTVQTEMQQQGLVSPAVGLHDASGGGLRKFFEDSYGFDAYSVADVPWDWLQANAGRVPIGIGGRRWNHWVAVRRSDGNGLELMNPAPGYQAVDDYLWESDFRRLGPFSAVWIDIVSEADMERIAELEAALAAERAARAQAEAELGDLRSYSSAVGHDIILPTVREIEAERAKPARQRRWVDRSKKWVDRLTPHVVE
jgi:hypothetical protein